MADDKLSALCIPEGGHIFEEGHTFLTLTLALTLALALTLTQPFPTLILTLALALILILTLARRTTPSSSVRSQRRAISCMASRLCRK